MPSYRFSWDAFDDVVVKGIAEAIGYKTGRGDEDPRTWLSNTVRRPNERFVQQAKAALESAWLPRYPGSTSLAQRLIERRIGPLGRPPSTAAAAARYVAKCRNSKTVRQLLCEELIRVGNRDRVPASSDAEARVPRHAILAPARQPVDIRTPYDYQCEAWERLSAHWAEAASTGIFQGLLVMPTGSGKTFTSATWLVRNVLDKGGRVLWIAHRHELLDQAAQAFHELCGLARNRERLSVRIVSGQHMSTTSMGPADDVLICSIASLTRRPDIVAEILADPKRMVVIDEAHHAAAKSYRDVLKHVLNRKPRQILGITATATRTIEREKPLLGQLFGGRTIFELKIQPLIERGFLARPIPVRVETHANVDAGVTRADMTHLAQFNELSEDWLERIAQLTERNAVIVEHLEKNRSKYGKTLIFAINVPHAVLLAAELRERGIGAEYVASYRPDGTSVDRDQLLEAFARRDSGLDVLVNVQMLTEGVDIPSIQTVFFTRPTSSEILMRQMIGRALRGPRAGGTEKAYLVSFEDHWETFKEWQSSLELVPEVLEFEESDQSQSEGGLRNALALPWELIRSVAAEIRSRGLEYQADAFEAVPHGWLLLERAIGDDSICQTIPVFEHQRGCWEQLLDTLSRERHERLLTLSADELHDE